MRIGAAGLALFIAPLLTVSHAQSGPAVPGTSRLLDGAQPDKTGAGLVLMSELRCGACHTLPRAVSGSIHWDMPRPRPINAFTGRSSLADFIRAPHHAEPGTTMPAVLDDDLPRADVEALVDSVLQESRSFDEAIDAKLLERGNALYHTVGCVACHAPKDEPQPRAQTPDPLADSLEIESVPLEVASLPLTNLSAKWSPSALEAFLLEPNSIRMPRMKLTDGEARALSAYLLSADVNKRAPEPDSPAKVSEQRVRRIFTRHCIQCHTVHSNSIRAPDTSTTLAPPLSRNSNLNGGCLEAAPAYPAARFNLTVDQREAIRDALRLARPREDASWRVLGTLAAYNCLACHARDGFGGVDPGRAPYFRATVEADLGDEGRIPPTLTGAGAKLTRDALEAVLRGHGDARPYMATRMPRFAIENVKALVDAFVQADTNSVDAPVNVSGLELHHRNRYGRELVGVDGLGCVSCHVIDGHNSLGMPAIDLALARDRLRPEWFMAYMLDPAAFRPGTRMPAFFTDDASANPKLFGGNARKQIEAIWIYLREVEQSRLPAGMEEETEYILVPEDEPIVHRTFMQDVGARAIAVGFPAGVHVAFDATHVRFALAWRGDYLDANATWNDRFAPYVAPLSNDRFRFPPLPPVVPAAVSERVWVDGDASAVAFMFRGFRLDDERVPIFQYEIQDMSIEERFQPIADGSGFYRKFTIRNVTEPLRYLAAIGAHVDPIPQGYEVNGAWGKSVHAPGAHSEIILGPGGWAMLVFELEPVSGRIEFSQEVRW